MTARAGTLLWEVEEQLAAKRQMLAFEPVDYGVLTGADPRETTMGSVFATNVSGARRILYGAARDHLLGLRGRQRPRRDFQGRRPRHEECDRCGSLPRALGQLGHTCAHQRGHVQGAARACANDDAASTGPAGRVCHRNLVRGHDDALRGVRRHPYPTRHGGAARARRLAPAGRGHHCNSAGEFPEVDRLPQGAPEGRSQDLRRSTRTRARQLAFVLGRIAPPHDAAIRHGPPVAHLDQADCRAGACESDQLLYGLQRVLRLVWRIDLARSARNQRRRRGRHPPRCRPAWGPRHVDARGSTVRAAVDVFQPLASGLETISRRLKSAFDPAGILNPGRMYAGF